MDGKLADTNFDVVSPIPALLQREEARVARCDESGMQLIDVRDLNFEIHPPAEWPYEVGLRPKASLHNRLLQHELRALTYGPTRNQADMITAAYKHKYTENLTFYTAVAATFNGPDAHYDLGAGGHGITTDCHDASGASGGAFANPHCYTGTTIVGVSTGVQWKF